MDEIKETNNDRKSILASLKDSIAKTPAKTKIKMLIFVIVLGVLAIMMLGFENKDVKSTTSSVSSSEKYTYYVSSLDYCHSIEEKLKKVLSSLNGIGNVEVMITLDSSMELVFAETKDVSSNKIFNSSDGSSIEVSAPLIIETSKGEEPLVVKEVLPKIKGVLVVCSSLGDMQQKLDIIYAVKSLLDINISDIQVLSNS